MTVQSQMRRSFSIGLLAMTLALCLYMLSFRAVIQSGDTLRAMDAVTSYARYGDWLMDESSYFKPALIIREDDELPLREYDVEERLNALLAAPLLRLADALQLGRLHTVWLFNILVSVGILGLLFAMLRGLGFGDAAALIVALTAGFGSNLWAYSQTFFREPLSALFALAALLLIQLGVGRRPVSRALSLALALAALWLAFLTKQSALFALPAALIWALPAAWLKQRRVAARLAWLPLALLAVMALLMLVDPLPAWLQRLAAGFGLQMQYAGEALRAYLLSPGASIWATSPVILLALPGCLLLWRRGRYQLALTVATLAAAYTLCHALSAGPHWSGGLSWPPRFLLPALPVIMLATAPLAENLLKPNCRRLRLVWAALLAYGIWIQFSGVSLNWSFYSQLLPPESAGYAEWLPSLYQPRYFRWVLLPQLWGRLGVDFLWMRAGLPVWGLSFGVLALCASIALIKCLAGRPGRWRYMPPLLAILSLNLILLNLSAAYDKDPRTQSAQPALHAAGQFLGEAAEPGDILLLTSHDSAHHILNHFDDRQPRSIALVRPLAQAASPKQPALVESLNPYSWFDVPSLRIIQHVMSKHERVWLLDNTSPFMRWSFRPLERYLALYAYPLGAAPLDTADDSARLLLYSTRYKPPDPMTLYRGQRTTSLRYGDSIALIGMELPGTGLYQPGDALAFSLLWQSDRPLDESYTVASFIADAATSMPIAQGVDSAPQAGFAPTSAWQPGVAIWDNRAIELPEDTAAGEYQLWIVMYALDSDSGEIQRLSVSGGDVAGDGDIGILPLSITVTALDQAP